MSDGEVVNHDRGCAMSDHGGGPPDAVPADVRHRTGQLLEQLRVYGAAYAELTRRFADHLGLHATDARALNEILVAEDQGDPLTPARLGARIGLSSGATTNLLHRLEQSGYVARARDRADRRSVTLRSSPGIAAPAGEFFAPLDGRLTALVASHDPARVDAVLAFLGTLNDDLADLLGTGEPRSTPYGGGPNDGPGAAR